MSNFITTTSRNLLQPLAFQGLSVCQHHIQMTERIRAQLGVEYAEIFAEPMFDNVQERIDWYTEHEGNVRSYQELSEQEQEGVKAKLAQRGEAILALATQLKGLSENSNQIAGHIMELALKIPDENFIYLVDEQPILVAWGFASSNAHDKPQDISRVTAASIASIKKTVPESSVSESVPVAAIAKEKVQDELVSLWWFIPLFLLILALLLYFFKDDLSAYFNPTEKLDLSILTEERDALKAELINKAGECKEESALVFPDDIKKDDMAFLEGLWRCDTDLVNRRTGKAVVVEYKFNEKGLGIIRIDSGRGLCTGEASARMEDSDTLSIITENIIQCPEGTSFVGQTIECSRDGVGVRCQGKNQRSSSLWGAQFYRINEVAP